MENVLVNSKALREVLVALIGPGHLIRELQATRDSREPGKKSISELTGIKNPIDVLLDEFNEQVTSGSLLADMLTRDVMSYAVRFSENEHDGDIYFQSTYEPRQERELRMSAHQLGVLTGMKEAMRDDQKVFLCRQPDNDWFQVVLGTEDAAPENFMYVFGKNSVINVMHELDKPHHQWTDLDLWKKFFQYFGINPEVVQREQGAEFQANPHISRNKAGTTLVIKADETDNVTGYLNFHVEVVFDDKSKFVHVGVYE